MTTTTFRPQTHNTNPKTTDPTGRSNLRARLAVWVSMLTLAVTAALAPHASAASMNPGDFSIYLPVANPTPYTLDDCRVEVGPVVDSVPYPNYRKIGGVRINCGSVHRWIDATVALDYWNGSRWVQYGDSAYGIRYNQSGSGTGIAGILRTAPYCFGTSNRGYYWSVVATVRTERAAVTVSSYWAQDNSGC